MSLLHARANICVCNPQNPRHTGDTGIYKRHIVGLQTMALSIAL